MSAAPYYSAHAPNGRAASCHHTEASSKRESPYSRKWVEPGEPVFQAGDDVQVIDRQSIHYGRQGVVRFALSPKKYAVKFSWSDAAVLPFKASQLRKVERKLLPEWSDVVVWNKNDKFACAWGVFRLDKFPDIPRRFVAYQKRQLARKTHTPDVICLPKYSQSTAQAAIAQNKAYWARERAYRLISARYAQKLQERLEIADLRAA